MKQPVNIKWCWGVMIAAALGSCQKLIEIAPPRDQLISSTIFLDSATASSAVLGLYSKVANPTGAAGDIGTLTAMYNCLMADEATYPSSTLYDAFTNNALTPDFYYIDGYWSYFYNNIYTANAIVEGAAASPLSPSLRDRLEGEAKFIRALCYFYLVNQYGPVPLVLGTNAKETTFQPRDSVSTVYRQIITDLTDAAAILPADYSLYGGKRTRATSWAAKALLARVYLYTQEWEKAEDMATAVLDNAGLFNLVRPLTDVFLPNNREGIMQFAPALQFSWAANVFVPFAMSTMPKYVLRDTLMSSFEDGDARKTAWVGYFGSNAEPYPAKYKWLSGSGAPPEYNQVLRLSEQYLIRAEARIRQDNYTGAAADIDSVRQRADLPFTTAADKPSLLLALEQERKVEFFCEWGHRWLDLKRMPGYQNPAITRAEEVLAPLKGANWQSSDLLFPIPQPAINANPNLTQN